MTSGDLVSEDKYVPYKLKYLSFFAANFRINYFYVLIQVSIFCDIVVQEYSHPFPQKVPVFQILSISSLLRGRIILIFRFCQKKYLCMTSFTCLTSKMNCESFCAIKQQRRSFQIYLVVNLPHCAFYLIKLNNDFFYVFSPEQVPDLQPSDNQNGEISDQVSISFTSSNILQLLSFGQIRIKKLQRRMAVFHYFLSILNSKRNTKNDFI